MSRTVIAPASETFALDLGVTCGNEFAFDQATAPVDFGDLFGDGQSFTMNVDPAAGPAQSTQNAVAWQLSLQKPHVPNTQPGTVANSDSGMEDDLQSDVAYSPKINLVSMEGVNNPVDDEMAAKAATWKPVSPGGVEKFLSEIESEHELPAASANGAPAGTAVFPFAMDGGLSAAQCNFQLLPGSSISSLVDTFAGEVAIGMHGGDASSVAGGARSGRYSQVTQPALGATSPMDLNTPGIQQNPNGTLKRKATDMTVSSDEDDLTQLLEMTQCKKVSLMPSDSRITLVANSHGPPLPHPIASRPARLQEQTVEGTLGVGIKESSTQSIYTVPAVYTLLDKEPGTADDAGSEANDSDQSYVPVARPRQYVAVPAQDNSMACPVNVPFARGTSLPSTPESLPGSGDVCKSPTQAAAGTANAGGDIGRLVTEMYLSGRVREQTVPMASSSAPSNVLVEERKAEVPQGRSRFDQLNKASAVAGAAMNNLSKLGKVPGIPFKPHSAHYTGNVSMFIESASLTEQCRRHEHCHGGKLVLRFQPLNAPELGAAALDVNLAFFEHEGRSSLLTRSPTWREGLGDKAELTVMCTAAHDTTFAQYIGEFTFRGSQEKESGSMSTDNIPSDGGRPTKRNGGRNSSNGRSNRRGGNNRNHSGTYYRGNGIWTQIPRSVTTATSSSGSESCIECLGDNCGLHVVRPIESDNDTMSILTRDEEIFKEKTRYMMECSSKHLSVTRPNKDHILASSHDMVAHPVLLLEHLQNRIGSSLGFSQKSETIDTLKQLGIFSEDLHPIQESELAEDFLNALVKEKTQPKTQSEDTCTEKEFAGDPNIFPGDAMPGNTFPHKHHARHEGVHTIIYGSKDYKEKAMHSGSYMSPAGMETSEQQQEKKKEKEAMEEEEKSQGSQDCEQSPPTFKHSISIDSTTCESGVCDSTNPNLRLSGQDIALPDLSQLRLTPVTLVSTLTGKDDIVSPDSNTCRQEPDQQHTSTSTGKPQSKTIGEDALPNQGLSSGETAVLKEFCKVFYAEIAEKLCLANEIVDVAAMLCGITPQGDSSTSTSKMTTTFNEGLEHASSSEDFLNVFRSTVLRKSDDASKRLSMLTKERNFLTTFPAGSPLVMPLNGLHSSPRAIGPVDQDALLNSNSVRLPYSTPGKVHTMSAPFRKVLRNSCPDALRHRPVPVFQQLSRSGAISVGSDSDSGCSSGEDQN